MVAVLRTEGLSKRFGKIQAVQGVDLSIEPGDIYGFLGLNGAGKTTTLRMILQLVHPDAGRVEIFGKEVRAHFIELIRRVGSLIELPAFYPHLSAERNLQILQLVDGRIEPKRVDELLERVGLAERRRSPVRTYSQGMRQRLAIAMALLHRPDLVLLDEPTNGLDPRGIQEIRNLIRELNQSEGTTFLVSSHLLPEVEVLCNRVGIIRDGRIVVQGRLTDLLSRASHSVRIACRPADRALELARSFSYVREAHPDAGDVRARLDPSDFARLNGDLVRAGLEVSAFEPARLTLEEFFLDRSESA